MKINILGQSIYFDEFPDNLIPMQKIFISNLLWLNKSVLPKLRIRVQIYSSLHLWNQLLTYNMDHAHMILSKAEFIRIKPYEMFKLDLDNGHSAQVLMCDDPKDRSGCVMYLIENNGKIEHFYAGAFAKIRNALLNETVATWLNMEVETLYLSMQRASENMKTCETSNVFSTIRQIFFSEKAKKIMIIVPQFGFENLVEHLTKEFPYMVGIIDTYLTHYELVVPGIKFLAKNLNNTRIMVISEELSMQQILTHYKEYNMCCIKFTSTPPISSMDKLTSKALIELQYSSYPNALLLDITSDAARPKMILGICNGDPKDIKIPAYLQKYVQKDVEKTNIKTPERANITAKKTVTSHKEGQQKTPEEVIKEAIYTLKKKQLLYLDDVYDDN